MDKIKIKKNKVFHESAGGYVFFNDFRRNNLYIAVLKKKDGKFYIPKGRIKKGENPKEASLREIKEELGIKTKLEEIGKVGINKYSFFIGNNKKENKKKVHLYAYFSKEKIKIKPLRREDFIKAEWMVISRAKKKISFDKTSLQEAISIFKSSKGKLVEINKDIVNSFKNFLKENLFAIISDGSLFSNYYNDIWSDVDLILAVEKNNLEIKQKISHVKFILEKKYKKHFGINIISKNELQNPSNPTIAFDGKTLQALLELNKFPERLLFYRDKNITFYVPNKREIQKYSLSNIFMFLLRERKDLSSVELKNLKDYKKMTERQIRASFIITKLAIQYLDSNFYKGKEEIINEAKRIFPDFKFNILEDNLLVIKKWGNKRSMAEFKNILKRTDIFIESFSKYILRK